MRISDWSSDVCSSDLVVQPRRGDAAGPDAEKIDRRDMLLRRFVADACDEGDPIGDFGFDLAIARMDVETGFIGGGASMNRGLSQLDFISVDIEVRQKIAGTLLSKRDRELVGDRKSTRRKSSHIC